MYQNFSSYRYLPNWITFATYYSIVYLDLKITIANRALLIAGDFNEYREREREREEKIVNEHCCECRCRDGRKHRERERERRGIAR